MVRIHPGQPSNFYVYVPVAQLVEQLTFNQWVEDSNSSRGTILKVKYILIDVLFHFINVIIISVEI